MARPIRVEFEGAVYHVMARGNERREIFRSARDRGLFLETLEEAVLRFGLLVHAYCLMPNHYHLVVETPRGNLSRAIGWLQVTYTVRFNRRHRRSGHLFQGRFKAHVVDAGEYGMQLVRYIHLNPVRPRRKNEPIPAGRAAELDAYPWSSHRAYAGLAGKPGWLCLDWLRFWGKRAGAARRSYRAAMAGAFGRTLPSPWDELRGGLVLGTDRLWETTRRLVKAKEADEELHWAKRHGARRVQQVVRQMVADEPDADVRMWVRVRLGGEPMVEVARDFEYRHQSGVTHAVNRVEALARMDRKLAARLQAFRRRFSTFKS
ncbi:MAG TPA: transposase [Verrucomicrobiae bacterium]|nr:transposase [Verrucomicrobiae bacterium]